ncbi:MAG: hypothetical protein LUC83_02910 [Clostridiales bacterium]|nr:hypothetical protein [Clostridiales bacterium]
MIELIIIIIVIAAVVFSRTSRRKAAAGKTGPDQRPSYEKPAGPDRQPSHARPAKPNQPKPGTRTAKPNKPKPGTPKAKPNQSADYGKASRYQAYKDAKQGGQTASAAVQQMHVDGILESARENTRAVQIDNDLDTIEIGDLMEKVQNSIVMGPDDTLTFRRDFLAEGMDFLNRCMEVPGTEAQI